MPQLIEVPDQGTVEFPDTMSDAEIREVIETKLLKRPPGAVEAAPQPPSEPEWMSGGVSTPKPERKLPTTTKIGVSAPLVTQEWSAGGVSEDIEAPQPAVAPDSASNLISLKLSPYEQADIESMRREAGKAKTGMEPTGEFTASLARAAMQPGEAAADVLAGMAHWNTTLNNVLRGRKPGDKDYVEPDISKTSDSIKKAFAAIGTPLAEPFRTLTPREIELSKDAPKAVQVGLGMYNALAHTGNFFASPLGIATLGMGMLPMAAQRAVAGMFAMQMGMSVPELASQLGEELGKPESERNYQRVSELLTSAGVTGFFTSGAGKHALTPAKIQRINKLASLISNAELKGTPAGEYYTKLKLELGFNPAKERPAPAGMVGVNDLIASAEQARDVAPMTSAALAQQAKLNAANLNRQLAEQAPAGEIAPEIAPEKEGVKDAGRLPASERELPAPGIQPEGGKAEGGDVVQQPSQGQEPVAVREEVKAPEVAPAAPKFTAGSPPPKGVAMPRPGVPESEREAEFQRYMADVDRWESEIGEWEAAQPQNKAIIIERPGGGATAITKDPRYGWRATTFLQPYRDDVRLAPWGHETYKTRLEAVKDHIRTGKVIEKLPQEILTEDDLRSIRERKNKEAEAAAAAAKAKEAPTPTPEQPVVEGVPAGGRVEAQAEPVPPAASTEAPEVSGAKAAEVKPESVTEWEAPLPEMLSRVERERDFVESLSKKYGSPVSPTVPATEPYETIFRFKDMLERAAGKSRDEVELDRILSAAKGIPDESRIAWAVANNPYSSAETFSRAKANDALRRMTSDENIATLDARREELRKQRGLSEPQPTPPPAVSPPEGKSEKLSPPQIESEDLISLVPKGYYIDGSTRGGVIRQNRNERWTSVQTDRGTWAIEYRGPSGESKFGLWSDREFSRPIDAALALKNREIQFTRKYLSEPAKPTPPQPGAGIEKQKAGEAAVTGAPVGTKVAREGYVWEKREDGWYSIEQGAAVRRPKVDDWAEKMVSKPEKNVIVRFPVTESDYAALQAISAKNNRRPYNPDLITEQAIKTLKREGYITGGEKNQKLTQKGLSKISDLEREAKERNIAEGDAFDQGQDALIKRIEAGEEVTREELEKYRLTDSEWATRAKIAGEKLAAPSPEKPAQAEPIPVTEQSLTADIRSKTFKRDTLKEEQKSIRPQGNRTTLSESQKRQWNALQSQIDDTNASIKLLESQRDALRKSNAAKPPPKEPTLEEKFPDPLNTPELQMGMDKEGRLAQRETLKAVYPDYDPRLHDAWVNTYNQELGKARMAAYEKNRGIAQEPSKPAFTPATPRAGELLKSLAEDQSGNYSPKRTLLYQQLGAETVPGLRLGDVEEAGRLYELFSKGGATKAEWDKWVADAKAQNRISTEAQPPPKFAEGDKVMVGEGGMAREGVVTASGPRGGNFVRTNLGEQFYEAKDIRPLEEKKPEATGERYRIVDEGDGAAYVLDTQFPGGQSVVKRFARNGPTQARKWVDEQLSKEPSKPTPKPEPAKPEPKPEVKAEPTADIEQFLKVEVPDVAEAKEAAKFADRQIQQLRADYAALDAKKKDLAKVVMTTRRRGWGYGKSERIKTSAKRKDVEEYRAIEKQMYEVETKIRAIEEGSRKDRRLAEQAREIAQANDPNRPLLNRMGARINLYEGKTPEEFLRAFNAALDAEILKRYPDATPAELKAMRYELEREVRTQGDAEKAFEFNPALRGGPFASRRAELEKHLSETLAKGGTEFWPEGLQEKAQKLSNKWGSEKMSVKELEDIKAELSSASETATARVKAIEEMAAAQEAASKAEAQKLLDEAQSVVDSAPRTRDAKEIKNELLNRIEQEMDKASETDKVSLVKTGREKGIDQYAAQGDSGKYSKGTIQETPEGKFKVEVKRMGDEAISVSSTVDTLEDAQRIIKAMAADPKGKAVIAVPGDGIFVLQRTGNQLASIWAKVKKISTAVEKAAEAGEETSEPSVRTKKAPPVGKGKAKDTETALKQLKKDVTEKDSERGLEQAWSDGKRAVATNGRLMVEIKGPFRPNADNTFPIEKADALWPKRENVERSVDNVSTEDLWRIGRLGEFLEEGDKIPWVEIFTDESGKIAGEGTTSQGDSAGWNDVRNKKSMGLYDSGLLEKLAKIARTQGNESIKLSRIDSGYLLVEGKNFRALVAEVKRPATARATEVKQSVIPDTVPELEQYIGEKKTAISIAEEAYRKARSIAGDKADARVDQAKIELDQHRIDLMRAEKKLGSIQQAPLPAAPPSPPPAAPPAAAPAEPPVKQKPMGGATPEEYLERQQMTIATKNAAIDRDRVELFNLPPMMDALRKSDPDLWAQTMSRIDEADAMGRDYVADLISRFKDNPFVPKDYELLALTWKRVDLKNGFMRADAEMRRAQADSDAALAENNMEAARSQNDMAEAARGTRDQIMAQIVELDAITGKGDMAAGTLAGRALRARQLVMKEDFTLDNMISERTARLGRKLNDAEVDELATLAAEYKEKSIRAERVTREQAEQLTQLNAEKNLVEIERDELRRNRPRYARPVLERAEQIVRAAEARASVAMDRLRALMDEPGAMSGPMNPEILDQLIIIGASKLMRATLNAAQFAAEIVAEVRSRLGDAFAERIRVIMESAEGERIMTAAAQRRDADLANEGRQAPRGTTEAVRQTATRNAAAGDVLRTNSQRVMDLVLENDPNNIGKQRYAVERMARAFVAQGMRGWRQIADAIHRELRSRMPNWDFQDTLTLFSKYGDYKRLSKNELDVEYRKARAEARTIRQIQDTIARKGRLATGIEYPEKADVERRYLQILEEQKKKYDVEGPNAENRLRTVLETRKRQIENRIRDVQWEIANRRQIVRERAPLPTDPEYEALKAELENLREQRSIVFADQIEAANMRRLITLAEQNEALWNRRLEQARQGVFDADTRTRRRATSTELDAIETRTEAVRDEVDRLKSLNALYQEQTQLPKLEASIAELERRMSAGELFPEPRAEKATTPALEAARAKRDELLAAIRNARKGTPQAIAAALERAEARGEELQRRINEGDVSARKRGEAPTSPQLEAQRAENVQMQNIIRELRAASRTQEELMAVRDEQIQKKIKYYEDLVKAGKIIRKKQPEPIKWTKEAIEANFELNRVHKKYLDMKRRDEMSKRPPIKKIADSLGLLWLLIRGIQTTGEFSAVLRQGGFTSRAHPVLSAKATVPMIKALISEKAQFEKMKEILTRENAPLYHNAKLFLSETGAGLASMEEMYMMRLPDWLGRVDKTKPKAVQLAQLATSFGFKGIEAFQRAYTTYLNTIRADVFDALVDVYGKDQITIEQIANLINVATGRGSQYLGRYFGEGANKILYAPRYSVSRLQLLLGQPFYHGTLATNKMVGREYLRAALGQAAYYALIVSALTAIADEMGAKVELNPRSSDFMKIKVGNRRLDPLFGTAQPIRLIAQLLTGWKKDKYGRMIPLRPSNSVIPRMWPWDQTTQMKYGGEGVGGAVDKYIRSKLAPGASIPYSAVAGKDFKGDRWNIPDQLKEAFFPITHGDIIDTLREPNIPVGILYSILAFGGEGVQTYDQFQPAERAR